VLAFEPRQSDLPLQVAFPILLANLTGELLGGSAAPTAAIVPGDPVSLPLPAGATGLQVTRPDGTTVEVPAPDGASTVSFSQTDELGVYVATPIGPSASAASTAIPSAGVSPGASGPAPIPGGPVKFAVDLFDPSESDIAPGSPSSIEALGGQAATSPGPGASGASTATPSAVPGATAAPVTGSGTTQEPRQPARDELWVPVVLVALIVLSVEWLVYHRDAVTRLWRSVRRRQPAPERRP